jgi:UDP-2,4-diacetamido-2,4,6-trideoxy-beta-L-altropyranose hydrolase
MEIKVAFRLDANSKVGFGHIMRCIALAQAFEKQNIAPWFLVFDTEAVKILKVHACKYKLLSREENEISQIKRLVSDEKISLLIVDTYEWGESEYKEFCGLVKVIVFDGIEKYPSNVWGVINYSSTASIKQYEERYLNTDVNLFVDKKYVPIRLAFFETKPRKRLKCSKVLITLGGTKQTDYYARIVNRIFEVHSDITWYITCGDIILDDKCLDKNILPVKETYDLSKLGNEMDLVICSAGTIVYELAAMQVPTVSFAMVENQMVNCKANPNMKWVGRLDVDCSLEKLIDLAVDLNEKEDKYSLWASKCESYKPENGAEKLVSEIIKCV